MNPFLFAWREIRYAPRYALLFVLAIGLGSSVLAAFSGLSASLERTLDARARELASADLRVEADENSLDALRAWAGERWPGARVAAKTDLLSMARFGPRDDVQQVFIRAAESGYPLYGRILALDGRALDEAIGGGRLLAEERFLALSGLAIGETVTLGTAEFTIAGVVGERTDVSVSFFQLAPTVFISRDDLRRTQLIVPGSRAQSQLFLNLPAAIELEAAAAALTERAARMTAIVRSRRDEGTGLSRFLRNTVFFLSVTGLLTLAMGGVTGAAVLMALLRRAAPSLAVARAVGAPPGFPVKVFAAWIVILSLVAGVVAVAGGTLVARSVAAGLGDILPSGIAPAEGPGLFAKILGSVIVIAFIFSAPALARLRGLPPNAALRNDDAASPEMPLLARFGWILLSAGLLFLLVWAHVGGIGMAAWGLAGWAGATGAAWLFAAILVEIGRRAARFTGRTTPLLAARELQHGFAYRTLAVAFLGLSASVILSVLLLRHNITSEFVRAAPPGSPNVFFMNLRPGEEEAFRAVAGMGEARFFPLIRGRVIAVDGVRAAEIQEAATDAFGSGDRLTREFGLTFGDSLPATDRVVDGVGLWDPAIAGPQVSVYDEFRGRFGIRRGTVLTFNILGREFTATVSSLRSINRSAREPFFYFQFRPGLIDTVPRTLMGGMMIPREAIPDAERRLARRFPHVTFFDLADVADLIERLLERLHRAVNAVAAAALAGGLLLMVSGILVNFAEIRREAVLFRTLGASRCLVLSVFLLEHLWSGVAAALAAGAVSLALTWAVMTQGFGSAWDPWWIGTLPFLAGFALLVATSGLLASALTLTARPMDVLRYE